MRYDERDDSELLELAQAGWSPAFAVLVHRHAPALLAAFADDPDPLERVTDVLLRAMRQLPERDPAAPVGPWLLALAGRPAPAAVPPVDEERLDPVWRQLALRWPDGRHVHHRRPASRLLVTAIGAIAIGIAVPTIVLGIPASAPEDRAESVRAQPLEDEPGDADRPVDLPTFEFPDVSGGPTEPAPGPVVPVEPPPTADEPVPTAPVVPAPPPPAPEPTPEFVPPPEETEEEQIADPVSPEPTDDGGDAGDDGDDDGDLPLVGSGGGP
jgi:hypothetical protein